MRRVGTQLEPQPFAMWVLGVQLVVLNVFLVLPRVGLPLWAVPPSVTLNDVLDGLVFPLVAALVYRWAFEALAPGGFSALPLMLVVLRTVGSGAHAVANSSDIVSGHTMRSAIGLHVYWWHESFAHYCTYVGEFALLALYVYRAAPPPTRRGAVELESDIGLELPGFVVATLHGLSAGVLVVGTRTAPALALVWAVVGALAVSRARRLASAVMKYAMVFCALSAMFVVTWLLLHGGALPTFDDVNAKYTP